MTFNTGAFFTTVRNRLGALSQSRVSGINTLLTACDGAPLAWASYMLATAWHETAKTMQPVREAYWLPEDWRKKNLRYWPWYGRGYVQLTWEKNYQRADDELHLGGKLIDNADMAMQPDIAARIMRQGMEEGWFTGVTLKACLPSSGVATHDQYVHARTIINGKDRDELVEDYAQVFERSLRDGGWA